MAVGTEVVAVRYEDIVADTPISVPYPVYEALDVRVYYGSASLLAVYNTDYTVSLADDFDTFTLTPTASLITKINNLIAADPTEENYITVRRQLDYLTDATAAAVRYTPFTSREFDRTALRFQQLDERMNRALVLSPNFVGDQPLLQLTELQPGASLRVNDAGNAIEPGPQIPDIDAQFELAKAQADRAEREADYAEEWAQSPNPISAQAGGDGVNDRSSKWWAQLSEQIALPDGLITFGKTDGTYGRITFNSVAGLKAGVLSTPNGNLELAYAPGAGKLVVVEGQEIWAQGFRYEVAASAATDHHVTTDGGLKLYVRRVTNRLFAEAFGLVANDESAAAANKATWATIRKASRSVKGSKIVEVGAGVYYFAPEVLLAGDDGAEYDNGLVIQSVAGATFKPAATTEDKSWFVVRTADNVRINGIEFDGNRANTPNMHADRCVLIVFDTEGTRVENCKVHSSYGKGICVAAGGTGKGAINVHVIDCEGWNCRSPVFMTDRTNIIYDDTRPCVGTVFERLVVGDTGHAGIAINDGSLNTKVLDCNIDNNNAVWAAIEVRGSRNTTISGCTGRRGRFGFRALTLNLAAIARGEICHGLILQGNTWEYAKESGLAINGVVNFSITGDISRNNGQAGGTHFGVIVIQQSGVQRAQNGSLNGVCSYDDQSVATQDTGISVLSSDNIRVSNPIIWGNKTHNKVRYNTDVPGLEVTGDGPDGATRKRLSQGTVSVPGGGGTATVTLTFATPFVVAPNWANASVFVGTAGAALRVEHIIALSTTAIQVRVYNTAASAVSGTVHAEAAYIS